MPVTARPKKWLDFLDELTGEFPAYDFVRLKSYIRHRPGWSASYLTLSERLGWFRRFGEAHEAVRRAEWILGRPHSAFAEAHAKLYFDAGRHGLAQRWIHNAIQLAPRDPELKLLLARSLRHQGKLREAEGWLRKIRGRAEELEGCIALELAKVFRSAERWDQARRWFQLAAYTAGVQDLELARQVPKWEVDALVDCDEGVASLLAAGRRLQTFPSKSALGHVKQAQALAALQRLPEALAQVKRLPPSRTAAMVKADFLRTCGRFERAAQHWLELASNSSETASWIFAGSCLARAGHLSQAEKCHRHASQCIGDPDEAVYNLALVLRAQGRYQEALECAHRAAEMSPDWNGPEQQMFIEDLKRSIEFIRADDSGGLN